MCAPTLRPSSGKLAPSIRLRPSLTSRSPNLSSRLAVSPQSPQWRRERPALFSPLPSQHPDVGLLVAMDPHDLLHLQQGESAIVSSRSFLSAPGPRVGSSSLSSSVSRMDELTLPDIRLQRPEFCLPCHGPGPVGCWWPWGQGSAG